MKLFMPRIEISLSKIRDNARMLCELYGHRGISLMGVSKAVLGEPSIVEAMIQGALLTGVTLLIAASIVMVLCGLALLF